MTIKQYVNLARDTAKHQGRSVPLSVPANNVGASIAQAEWWVEPVGGDNVDKKYLSAANRAVMKQSYTRNKADTFRNTVKLPHVGGDKYVVKCSKRGDRSSPVTLEEIQTWRKIFYTVHYMNDACRDMFTSLEADFKAAFEPGFIELERVGFDRTLADEVSTRASNSLSHLYRRRPELSDKPWHLRIVVLNNIYDPSNAGYGGPVAGKVETITTDKELDDQTATSWLRSARARTRPRGSWKNIAANVSKTGARRVQVDLTGHAIFDAAITAGTTVQVEVQVREMSSYLGHSIGNFCCVRIREDPARARTIILQTFTHEIGHGLQQVVFRSRTHDAAGKHISHDRNPNWYNDDYGGQGPHCHTNARLAPSADTPSGQMYEPSGGTLCTMFDRDDSNVDAQGRFCDVCKPLLRRVDLGRSKMRSQNWGSY